METVMAAPRRTAAVRTEVVSDPTVMSGDPVVRGTRILAETILSYLRAGCPAEEIFRDYPSLPVDGKLPSGQQQIRKSTNLEATERTHSR
jgi:uncharacterized protein (DUF433 family)